VHGDRDPIYPIDLTIDMYKAMTNAYLWIVPNGGHVPISGDLVEEFMNNIERFL
jgi:pimeloyl-ACP methyl ester carboxylesterase